MSSTSATPYQADQKKSLIKEGHFTSPYHPSSRLILDGRLRLRKDPMQRMGKDPRLRLLRSRLPEHCRRWGWGVRLVS